MNYNNLTLNSALSSLFLKGGRRLFYITLFYNPNPTQYLNLITNLLSINTQQIRNLLREKS